MEAIKEFIRPELLVLIPVLYFIGTGLKQSVLVPDNYIPLLLGAAGIILSTLYTAAASQAENVLMMIFVGITQGILCAGCSVYVNQLIKQQKE